MENDERWLPGVDHDDQCADSSDFEQEFVHDRFHHFCSKGVAILLAVVEVIHMFLVPCLVTFVDADIQGSGTCPLDKSERPFVWVPAPEPDDRVMSSIAANLHF